MNTSRDRRLARLEQDKQPRGKIIYAWRDDPRESAARAIARRCPKGVPSGARLVICSWQPEGKRIPPARG